MITIYYSYVTKSGEVKQGERDFHDIDKAQRFYWVCVRSKDKHYQYFSSDDPEESNELWRRLP